MKNYFLLFSLFFGLVVKAQVPNKMSYQTVVRNSSNQLINNQQVGIKISLLQGSATGTSVFTQTFTPTTNANGLASIVIGDTSTAYSNINWASGGPFFIKSEIDPTGGTNYTIEATSELMSVPYAMVAGSVAGLGNNIFQIKPYHNDGNFIYQDFVDKKMSKEFGYSTQEVNINGPVYANLNFDKENAPTNIQKIYIYSRETPVVYTKLKEANDISISTVKGNISLNGLNYVSNMLIYSPDNNLYLTSLKKQYDTNTTFTFNVSSADLSAFEAANGSLTFIMDTLNLPKLSRANKFTIYTKGIAPNISLPLFDTVNQLNIYSYDSLGNPIDLELPNLKTLGKPNDGSRNYAYPQLNYSINLKSYSIKSINLPNLFNLPDFRSTGIYIVNNRKLVSFDCNKVSQIGEIQFTNNTQLKNINFFSLQNASSIKINQNNQLDSLFFNNLDSISDLTVINNTNLQYINLPHLFKANNIDLYNNNFNSNTVNNILHQLLSLNFTSSCRIQLYQNPPAPPTGQGIIDKNALKAKGFYVYTD